MRLLNLQALKQKKNTQENYAGWRCGMKKINRPEVIINQMSWTANTITELYKARWEVEIFFRDIKTAHQIFYRNQP